MKKLSIIAIVLSSIALVGQIFVFAMPKGAETALATNTGAASAPAGKPSPTRLHVLPPAIPDSLDFCGEAVPLDLYYVRESLDRELIVNTFGHTSTLLYFKRANRWFPVIEPILKKNGVPEDMKYLCVIESGLTNATSPAKAQGFWQFMKTTGQAYGLEIGEEVDMRNNVEAATEAACQYLKKLRKQLGSWTAAAAAYNCGEGGLTKNMSRQGVDSYYDTRLNNETTRYVYRILAVKHIMQHPQEYGFYLRRCDLYPALPTRTATLSGQNVDLYDFAKANGTTYKTLKEYNPWLTSEKLTNRANKSYTVKLPTEGGQRLSKIWTEKDRSKELIERM